MAIFVPMFLLFSALAAFLEVEGNLFQILVGRDGEGKPWSTAVSGEE